MPDKEIITNTHVPAPNVTTNDINSLSHAPQIEQHTPPSDQVVPHRVLPPGSDNNYPDVFIGNVRGIIKIYDIKGHLLDSGVRDIGNTTQLSSRHHAAFRVFIGDDNMDNTMYNRKHWNERIKVEPYKTGCQPATVVCYQQLNLGIKEMKFQGEYINVIGIIYSALIPHVMCVHRASNADIF